MTDCEVIRLKTAKGRIQAAELKDGRCLEAWQFISNVHPSVTLKMVDPGMFRSGFRNRIEQLENTPGFFSVYMVMKEKSLPYQNYNHFHYSSDDYFRDDIPDRTWPQTYLLYTPAHGDLEGFATIASVLSFMPFSQVSPWAHLKPEERGQSYQDFKAERAEKLLAEVEKRYPGLKQNILSYYVSTPLTFQDYTGTKDGSAYGILKDCNHPAASIVSPRTRIPNLFLTGQNLNVHGVLGTTISAVLTCTELTGFRELVTKIVRA
jgi:all-trans-retinol 13,14-reductase